MSGLPWVRFFPSDWLAGTRGMSAAEMGVYISLISMMYERNEPIAEDPARLARLCGASNSSFKTILATLVEEGKITRTDRGLWNGRVEKEQVYRSEKSEVGKQAAEKRWQKSQRKQNTADANAMQSQCERNANQKPEPELKEATAPLKDAPAARSSERKATPRSELEVVLDAEHAAQVVEHRKRIGAPLTASAAAKLAKNLAKYDGDPNEAADEMLANGWRGFKPEWTQPRRGNHERPHTTRPNNRGDEWDAAFDNIAARQHFRGSGTPYEAEREHVDSVPGRTVSLSRGMDGSYGDGGQYPRLVGSRGRF